MKKNYLFMVLLLTCINAEIALAATCAGREITSTDGTKWCNSHTPKINWPSAYSWCQAQGLEMMSFTNCGYENGTCTHAIHATAATGWGAWLKETPNGASAYIINYHGGVSTDKRINSGFRSAVCKMP